MKHIKHIANELIEHLPYSTFSVATGLVILGFLSFFAGVSGTENIAEPSEELFHIFHPLHILFSATATTAMFWRHEKKILKTIIIGFVGSVGICGASDIFMPYASGFLLGAKMKLHVCIIEHPHIILPFVVVGIFLGFILPTNTHKSTIFSHSYHVLLSSMASILYLIGYGLSDWIYNLGMVFIYMVLAVIIPCCASDIVFPLIFISPSHYKPCKYCKDEKQTQ